MQRRFGLVTKRRKVIVHIATSADGYIARSDGDLEWLTSRPAPKGFYGMNAFMRSVDTKVLGRKTYDVSLRLGAKFDSQSRNIVFSGHPPPADAPSGVEFVNDAIGPFVSRLREQPGKDIWLMGGGEIIASFLDAQAIDEFVISVAPVFIGGGNQCLRSQSRTPKPGARMEDTLQNTTTFSFDGYRITEYKGVVRGIVVRSPTLGQGFLGGLKQIVGGQIGAYAEMCEQARQQAYDRLLQHARERGANAIVGLRYESSEVGRGGSATEVLCYGTAVVIQRA